MRSKLSFVALFALVVAVPMSAYELSVWVPPWDAAATSSMQRHADKVDESNPVWYTLTSTGAIVTTWNADNPTVRAALVGTSRVMPTIQNYVDKRWNGNLVATLVATPQSREVHAEAIRALVVQNAYDGIDIDYEKVPATAKDNFSAFITLLGEKLHAANKKLSVSVHAKTSDSQTWSGPGGTDFAALGRAADSVKIMAYDYHWDGSDAGALTPLEWLDAVLSYATARMPASKVIVGLPWYGYNWQGTDASTVSFAQASSLAQTNGVTPSRHASGELTFAYAGRTVYYQDAESFALKVATITRKFPTIGGFAAWAVGTEDPEVWSRIGAIKGSSSSSPATPPPAPPRGRRRSA